MSLRQKTALSFLWCAIRSGIEQGFSFIIFLFLGRLLTPDDFGLVALAAGIVEVLRLLSWVGLYEVIIGAPQLDEAAADSAFWTSVTLGLILAGVVVLAAPAIARFFVQPPLTDVIRVMSLIVVVSALGITHTGRLARNFGHKALAMRALAANFAGGIAALAVILAGGGMWALVAQRLAAELIQTVAAWTALPWVPRFRFSLSAVKQMAGFCARVTVANLVNGVSMRVQEALVGTYLPIGAVGSLRVASRLTELFQQMVFMPANQVSMVAFSRLQDDRESLQRAYIQAVRLSGLVAFPCFLALAATGPDLIPWLFGRQWQASAPVLQTLCLAVVPTTLLYFMAPVQVAIGRTGSFAWLSVLHLGLGAATTVALAPLGIVAVGAGLTLRAWILMPVVLFVLKHDAGIRPVAVLAAMAPSFIAAAAAALPALAMSHLLRDSLPAPLLVLLELAAYGLTYCAALISAARSFLCEAASALLPLLPTSLQIRVRRLLGLDPAAAET